MPIITLTPEQRTEVIELAIRYPSTGYDEERRACMDLAASRPLTRVQRNMLVQSLSAALITKLVGYVASVQELINVLDAD